VEVLRSITNKLCGKWGSLERVYGFFHVADINKVRKTAFNILSDDFEDKIALNDVISAITAHHLDPYRKLEAESWLLGELMDFKDLYHLHILYDLKKGSYAFTMLKIIIENSILKTLLFIDDFDKIISLMKYKDEAEEIFDPSYLYGKETTIPGNITALKALDRVMQLRYIKGLRIVITLKNVESLEEIKKIIQEKYKKLLINFKEPIIISDFVENDVYEFYKKSMEFFLKNANFNDFAKEYPNSYFPLNENILKKIYINSKGNPREVIKLLIQIFNEIIFSDIDLDDILKKYENKTNIT
jgi:hypothetical protein